MDERYIAISRNDQIVKLQSEIKLLNDENTAMYLRNKKKMEQQLEMSEKKHTKETTKKWATAVS